jgi:hypothetical protein
MRLSHNLIRVELRTQGRRLLPGEREREVVHLIGSIRTWVLFIVPFCLRERRHILLVGQRIKAENNIVIRVHWICISECAWVSMIWFDLIRAYAYTCIWRLPKGDQKLDSRKNLLNASSELVLSLGIQCASLGYKSKQLWFNIPWKAVLHKGEICLNFFCFFLKDRLSINRLPGFFWLKSRNGYGTAAFTNQLIRQRRGEEVRLHWDKKVPWSGSIAGKPSSFTDRWQPFPSLNIDIQYYM